ncbi:MAG: glycerate kinase [Rhodothermales bacterium]
MDGLIDDARAIFLAAVQGVQADVLLDNVDWSELVDKPFDAYNRVVVAGMGKAAMAMAWVVEHKLGDHITEGCVVVPKGYSETLPFPFKQPQKIIVLEAGHPIPDETSEEAAQVLFELAEQCTADDLFLVLISGGGSALTTSFAPGISMADGQKVVQLLMRCGADIRELNTVRKHVSLLGGGRLAQKAAPAEIVSLVISDVVGDDLSVIASGPTVGDPTTFDDAIRVLRSYDLWDEVPVSVREYLLRGKADPTLDTPKPDSPVFSQVKTRLIGTNKHALDAACREAAKRQYEVKVHKSWVEGEARVAGEQLAEALLSTTEQRPVCHLWGGETTVTVKGKGVGGRNQELALGSAFALEGDSRKVLLLSGGTDGIDGPTDAAGAYATPGTLSRARQRKRDPQAYLDANDAYTFFLEMNTLLKPGPTHTNVMDIVVGLVMEPGK